ncbi:hypothetical protein J1TS3_03320 [Siminovitchia fordii]|uniref:Uncharacterized protein n=1 Tax=Siminovitchia fordii TaxID=254759 RepID=A0ABQ4K2U4_9BACI|nr:hypothetical protein J1TS3_03320 [Siminovitchia fordii]
MALFETPPSHFACYNAQNAQHKLPNYIVHFRRYNVNHGG